MILDELNEFCDATAMNTGGAATYLVGDVIDLQETGKNLGAGQPLYLVVQIETTATSGGSATGSFQLASDAAAAIAVDGSQTIHSVTDAIAVASLTAGFTFVLPVPPEGSITYERYLGVQQTTAAAAFTAGKINAFLTNEPHQWKAAPDAIN